MRRLRLAAVSLALWSTHESFRGATTVDCRGAGWQSVRVGFERFLLVRRTDLVAGVSGATGCPLDSSELTQWQKDRCSVRQLARKVRKATDEDVVVLRVSNLPPVSWVDEPVASSPLCRVAGRWVGWKIFQGDFASR